MTVVELDVQFPWSITPSTVTSFRSIKGASLAATCRGICPTCVLPMFSTLIALLGRTLETGQALKTRSYYLPVVLVVRLSDKSDFFTFTDKSCTKAQQNAVRTTAPSRTLIILHANNVRPKRTVQLFDRGIVRDVFLIIVVDDCWLVH